MPTVTFTDNKGEIKSGPTPVQDLAKLYTGAINKVFGMTGTKWAYKGSHHRDEGPRQRLLIKVSGGAHCPPTAPCVGWIAKGCEYKLLLDLGSLRSSYILW
jgi:hypothetical protein